TKEVTVGMQAEQHTLVNVILLFEDQVHRLVDLFATHRCEEPQATRVNPEYGYSSLAYVRDRLQQRAVTAEAEEQVHLAKAVARLIGLEFEFSELSKSQIFLKAGGDNDINLLPG